jgi:hypothetical protein
MNGWKFGVEDEKKNERKNMEVVRFEMKKVKFEFNKDREYDSEEMKKVI